MSTEQGHSMTGGMFGGGNSEGLVLVVDDEADVRKVARMTLEKAGYTVVEAEDGEQAIERIRSGENPLLLGVIVTDINMPKVNGLEAIQFFQQQFPSVSLIVMTGYPNLQSATELMKQGLVDYLVKPINHQELLARVKVHINNAQVTQATKQALDDSGQYLMSLDSEGHILWRTEQAQAIVKTLTSKERVLVNDWIKDNDRNPQLMLQQSPITLTLTLIEQQAEDSYLVKFKAQDLKFEKQTLKNKLKITRREAEVLFWVAQGKTDWEISQILSISDRTVNKHLEQVYRKLGVNNRTSASTMALQVLN